MQEHRELLEVLCRAETGTLSTLAEQALEQLGEVEVLHNRTGLVMLPYRDTVKGTTFHLGEVLVSEAHLRQGDLQGYGMVLGRDLRQAMEVAVLDLCWQKGLLHPEILLLCTQEKTRQQEKQHALLCQVESTRVEMETF